MVLVHKTIPTPLPLQHVAPPKPHEPHANAATGLFKRTGDGGGE